MSSTDTLASLKTEWGKYDQAHVFKFADNLTEEQLSALLKQVNEIDVADVDRIYKATTKAEVQNLRSSFHHEIKPFTNVTKFADATKEQRDKWETLGMGLLADNKVGVLLLAGGQASRLGCLFPKGMYDLGLPSKKSLYQLQVERAVKLQTLAAQRHRKATAAIMWYIMTSPATHKDTVDHFQANNYFGQPASHFFFFNQHMQPCVTPSGRILLESSSSIAVAPNGNGGLYKAMHASGALADMQRKGITRLNRDNRRPANIAFSVPPSQ
eukprot:TRINITY_DN4732_c0_g1_i3.p1 TRINITY_DN4732_c0_g1~~TRINITY_DN4732_c0_g1_i3.p1  ORF type:complete len:269 (+),score=74.12 TRINITY_DN4732_c0_g1_i3:203-1009(+)